MTPTNSGVSSQHAAHSAESGAKIGPNSIIQTVQALKEMYGPIKTQGILAAGGKADLMENLPSKMTNEQEFNDLEQLVFNQLGTEQATQILRRSGELTAYYLLGHRIPKPAQWLIKILPRTVGLKLLLTAIEKNAWTFVGSGNYSFVTGKEPTISISNCLACRNIQATEPACSFYAGTFEKLLQVIIHAGTKVQETECQACGAAQCVFTVTYN